MRFKTKSDWISSNFSLNGQKKVYQSVPFVQRGILFAYAPDEWNNLSSAPFLIFERAAAGF